LSTAEQIGLAIIIVDIFALAASIILYSETWNLASNHFHVYRPELVLHARDLENLVHRGIGNVKELKSKADIDMFLGALEGIIGEESDEESD